MAEVLGANSCANPDQGSTLSSPDSYTIEVQTASRDAQTTRCCMGTQTTAVLLNGAHRPLTMEAERGASCSRGQTLTGREVGTRALSGRNCSWAPTLQ
ncbi:hypothetical protein LSAT2_019563 [Lamellibrachia satsuma]|nr:hypothetical protein LSAT2_019563 [Lamellibrachia satsuma]